MAVATRLFSNIAAAPAGVEITNILGGVRNISSGYIQQIIIRASSGGGSTVRVEVRYTKGDNSIENLIYLFIDGSLPSFIDSNIEAPFGLRAPNLAGDISIFIAPEFAGIFEIRIDMDIDIFKI